MNLYLNETSSRVYESIKEQIFLIRIRLPGVHKVPFELLLASSKKLHVAA